MRRPADDGLAAAPPGRRLGSRPARVALLALPSLLLLLLLLGLEAGVRLTRDHVTSLRLFVPSAAQRHGFTDAREVSVFEGDPLRLWRLRPGLDRVVWDFTLVSTNGEGLRHPREIARKPPGGVRVLCLGDSVTFGYRVPVVFAERPDDHDRRAAPYPRLLEAALRVENPGRWVEVVALAVPGYSSHQGLAWLRRELGRLEPDLVTACFGWNDVSLRERTDAEAIPTDLPHVLARAAAGRSQAVAHLVLALRERRRAAAGAPRERVPAPAYVDNHLEMARLAARGGARFAVVAPVYRDATTFPEEAVRLAAHRACLREAAAAASLPYLEVPELTEAGAGHNGLLFGELIHPSAQGHRLLALRLLGLLGDRNLLPGFRVPARLPGDGEAVGPED